MRFPHLHQRLRTILDNRGIRHDDVVDEVLEVFDDVAADEALGLGVVLIAEERLRQIAEEQWTSEHDAGHVLGELLAAAQCYVVAARRAGEGADAFHIWKEGLPDYWPWDPEDWKPSADAVRNIAKAGALLAAEIDRIEITEDSEPNQAKERLITGDPGNTGGMLSPLEHSAMAVSGRLANMLGKIIGGGSAASGDLTEMVADIHAIQHRIMAQAAARAYPSLYRPLGGWRTDEAVPESG